MFSRLLRIKSNTYNKKLSTSFTPNSEIYREFVKFAIWPITLAIVSFTFGIHSMVITHDTQIKNLTNSVNKSLDVLTNSVNSNKLEAKEDMQILREDMKEGFHNINNTIKKVQTTIEKFKVL